MTANRPTSAGARGIITGGCHKQYLQFCAPPTVEPRRAALPCRQTDRLCSVPVWCPAMFTGRRLSPVELSPVDSVYSPDSCQLMGLVAVNYNSQRQTATKLTLSSGYIMLSQIVFGASIEFWPWFTKHNCKTVKLCTRVITGKKKEKPLETLCKSFHMLENQCVTQLYFCKGQLKHNPCCRLTLVPEMWCMQMGKTGVKSH